LVAVDIAHHHKAWACADPSPHSGAGEEPRWERRLHGLGVHVACRVLEQHHEVSGILGNRQHFEFVLAGPELPGTVDVAGHHTRRRGTGCLAVGAAHWNPSQLGAR
jgi:hypothetical protein